MLSAVLLVELLCVIADAESDAIAAAKALSRGDWGTAWRMARRAAEAGVDSADVLTVRGIALARLGCVDDAESCLRAALGKVRCVVTSDHGAELGQRASN